MIQTRKTGSTISCLRRRRAYRAALPVTMPRKSDSDMCRDGSRHPCGDNEHAVYEHGGLHGVSDHHHWVDQRKQASIRPPLHVIEERRRWRILAETRSQIGRQDKRRAVGWGAGCWNCWGICASQLPSRLASSIKNGVILALSAPSLTLRLEFRGSFVGRC